MLKGETNEIYVWPCAKEEHRVTVKLRITFLTSNAGMIVINGNDLRRL